MLLGGMWDHPRVLGRPLRGVALLLLGAGLAVAAAPCLRNLSRYESQEVLWTVLAGMAIAASALAVTLGVHEIGRPIWMVAGSARSRRLRGAAIRWSTKYPELLSGYGRVTEIYAPSFPWIANVISAAFARNLRTEITFDDPPLRVGHRARMTLRVSLGGVPLADSRLRFRLRCLRESDARGVELQSRMSPLADLRPRRIGHGGDAKGTTFTLDFDLPPGLPGSDLLAPQPVYWELAVKIDGLARPCEERFFVPVEA